MATRRNFLKSGLGACAAGATAPLRSRLCTASPGAAVLPYYQAIFDERFEDSRVFAAGAAARRILTAAIRGDITRLFFDDLDLRWKQGPVLLAGYTTPASLFCLDLLARDRGMRVSHCATKPSAEAALAVLDGAPPRPSMSARLPFRGRSALVFWIIAPRAT
jgi:hypothetical protein